MPMGDNMFVRRQGFCQVVKVVALPNLRQDWVID
jgi:hypothetical protein